MICGTCGADIESRPAQWARRYVCPNGCVEREAARVDETVADWVGVIVLWPTSVAIYPDRPLPRATGRPSGSAELL